MTARPRFTAALTVIAMCATLALQLSACARTSTVTATPKTTGRRARPAAGARAAAPSDVYAATGAGMLSPAVAGDPPLV